MQTCKSRLTTLKTVSNPPVLFVLSYKSSMEVRDAFFRTETGPFCPYLHTSLHKQEAEKKFDE